MLLALAAVLLAGSPAAASAHVTATAAADSTPAAAARAAAAPDSVGIVARLLAANGAPHHRAAPAARAIMKYARQRSLDPLLVVGLIGVENAEPGARAAPVARGAQGVMQVKPSWTRDLTIAGATCRDVTCQRVPRATRILQLALDASTSVREALLRLQPGCVRCARAAPATRRRCSARPGRAASCSAGMELGAPRPGVRRRRGAPTTRRGRRRPARASEAGDALAPRRSALPDRIAGRASESRSGSETGTSLAQGGGVTTSQPALAGPPLTATYRLQLGPHLDFDGARALVPYVRRLGASHLYLSPVLEARAGSTHGYDVVDPSHANPALGGDAGFLRLADAARDAGLGIVLDVVPNHMGAGPENPYWDDVLALGEDSPHARWFDIDWQAFARRDQRQVVLPVLGDELPRALDQGHVTVELAAPDARPGGFRCATSSTRSPWTRAPPTACSPSPTSTRSTTPGTRTRCARCATGRSPRAARRPGWRTRGGPCAHSPRPPARGRACAPTSTRRWRPSRPGRTGAAGWRRCSRSSTGG
jgi:hypothetical protein